MRDSGQAGVDVRLALPPDASACCLSAKETLGSSVPTSYVSHPTCSGARAPNPTLLAGCLRIYAGEIVIDVIKHAVLGKFNEIR